MEELKKCSKCKQELPLSEFWNSKKSKDGKFHICKSCYNTYFYSKEKNNDYKKQQRTSNMVEKIRYTDWGGVILRDKDCTECFLYQNGCNVSFSHKRLLELAKTCKDFKI